MVDLTEHITLTWIENNDAWLDGTFKGNKYILFYEPIIFSKNQITVSSFYE